MSNPPKPNACRYASVLSCLLLLAALFLPKPVSAQDSVTSVSNWSTSVQPRNEANHYARTRRNQSPRGRRPDRPLAPRTAEPQLLPMASEVASTEIAAIDAARTMAPNDGNDSVSIVASMDREKYKEVAAEYCQKLGPITGEARALFLQKAFASLDDELNRKTEELNKRIAEHVSWLSQRQQMMEQIGAALVETITRMRPDAAAQQISSMEENLAAALLLKVGPKASSALLNEMPPAKAGRLVSINATSAGLGARARAKAVD